MSPALELAYGLLRRPDHIGARMAVRAVGGLEDPDVIAASLAALCTDVANELRQHVADLCPRRPGKPIATEPPHGAPPPRM